MKANVGLIQQAYSTGYLALVPFLLQSHMVSLHPAPTPVQDQDTQRLRMSRFVGTQTTTEQLFRDDCVRSPKWFRCVGPMKRCHTG